MMISIFDSNEIKYKKPQKNAKMTKQFFLY